MLQNTTYISKSFPKKYEFYPIRAVSCETSACAEQTFCAHDVDWFRFERYVRSSLFGLLYGQQFAVDRGVRYIFLHSKHLATDIMRIKLSLGFACFRRGTANAKLRLGVWWTPQIAIRRQYVMAFYWEGLCLVQSVFNRWRWWSFNEGNLGWIRKANGCVIVGESCTKVPKSKS